MKQETIDKLYTKIPETDQYFQKTLTSLPDVCPRSMKKLSLRNRARSDFAFSWHFIEAIIRNNIRFPNILNKPEFHDIKRAYHFEKTGKHDEAISEALSLNLPDKASVSNAIKAFILTGASSEEIYEYTGTKPATVDAFAELFFNVRDRTPIDITQAILPNGRIDSMRDGFTDNTPDSEILLRAAITSSKETIALMLGLATEEASSVSSKLIENNIMKNCALLISADFTNQKSAIGLAHAKGIIAAEKQRGDVESDTDTPASMSSEIMKELIKYSKKSSVEILEARKALCSG